MSKKWKPAISDLQTRLGTTKIGDGTKVTSSRTDTRGSKIKPLVKPVYNASTYVLDYVEQYQDILESEGYLYLRMGTPNLEEVECAINELEGGAGSLVFTSGMAAITTALTAILRPGDHMVCCNPVATGTYKYLTNYLSQFNVEFTWVTSGSGIEAYKKAIKSNTKMLYGETPCNPTMAILDLEEFAALGKSTPGCVTMVDATFASPYLLKASKFGIDIVIHSCTKYLGGHSDLVAGELTLRSVEMWQNINVYRTILGNNLPPSDCFLLHRGIKTLHVRMERHCYNAQKLAEFLENHPKIENVYYPGLKSHRGHEVAKRQMKGFGGMISFEVKNGLDAAKTLIEKLKLITLTVSLGGVESMICHPASTTHPLTEENGEENLITPGLVRFSVGLEDLSDLQRDLEQALDAI